MQQRVRHPAISPWNLNCAVQHIYVSSQVGPREIKVIVHGCLMRKNIVFCPIKDAMSTDDIIQRDLSLCSDILSGKNHFSQTQQDVVRQNMAALRTFILPQHLLGYNNPCWYTDFDIQNLLNRSLEPRIVANLPKLEELYSKQEVLQVLEEIPHRRKNSKLVTGQRQLFCLPSVFLAGFPKCGTTALYEMITAHPAIATPHSKEIHFWNVFSKTKDYIYKVFQSLHYLYHFSPAGEKILLNPKTITLDASPDTILDIAMTNSSLDSDICIVPTVISTLLPEAKYIVLMRNPVDRLWSAYWYFCIEQQWKQKGHGVNIPDTYMNHGPEAFHDHAVGLINEYVECLHSNSTEFECARRVPPTINDSCICSAGRLSVGLYYLHLVKWLSIVPRQQFLFLRAEDLASRPHEVMHKVWKFLALESPLDADLQISHANRNTWMKRHKEFKLLPLTRHLLSSFYHPYNQRLAALLEDDSFLWTDYP